MVLDDADIQKIRDICNEEIDKDRKYYAEKYEEIKRNLKEKERIMGKEAYSKWIREENAKHGWD